MKFFADTAEVSEIRELADTGFSTASRRTPASSKIRPRLPGGRPRNRGRVKGPVSAEVVALDYDGMMREAEILRRIKDNMTIKVPLTPAA